MNEDFTRTQEAARRRAASFIMAIGLEQDRRSQQSGPRLVRQRARGVGAEGHTSDRNSLPSRHHAELGVTRSGVHPQERCATLACALETRRPPSRLTPVRRSRIAPGDSPTSEPTSSGLRTYCLLLTLFSRNRPITCQATRRPPGSKRCAEHDTSQSICATFGLREAGPAIYLNKRPAVAKIYWDYSERFTRRWAFPALTQMPESVINGSSTRATQSTEVRQGGDRAAEGKAAPVHCGHLQPEEKGEQGRYNTFVCRL